MKNLKFILVLLIIVTFASCVDETASNQEDINANSKALKLDLSNLDLNLDISFKPEIITYSSTSILDIKKHLISKIKELNTQIDNRIKKDKNTDMVSYQIIVNDKGYTIKDWTFYNKENQTRGFGDPVEYDSWSCPTGSTQVGGTCYSASCVANNIQSALTNFSSGDTVTLTLHHGGPFGGVTVCASNSSN